MTGRFPLNCRKCGRFKSHNLTSDDPTYECSFNNQTMNQSELPLWSMDCPLGKNPKTELEDSIAEFLDAMRIYEVLNWMNKKVEKLSDWWAKK